MTPSMRDQMNHKPSGVYFGLSHQDYLADTSLSFSGIKALAASPLTYWASSWMNPDRVKEESQAMALGTLVHKMVLEGRTAFDSAFAVAPEKEQHPTALHGSEALREHCRMLCVKQSGTIAEMCDRILEVDPEATLWPVIMATFHRFAMDSNRKVIASDLAFQVERVATMVERAASKAFSGGHSEVSIFWTDETTGVPLKARIDYLKTWALIDLKSFSNSVGLPVGKAVVQAVAKHGYHIQAIIYLKAVEQAKRLFKEGAVFVDKDYPVPLDEAWSNAFALSSAHRFFYVFTETGPATNVVVREFQPMRADGEETLLCQTGMNHFKNGVQTFNTCLTKHGFNPWVTDHQARPFIDEEFPLWIQD